MLFNSSPPVILAIGLALVIGITFHEFSHALIADQLGDHRPRALGRVSLNPVRHIDPLGALAFLLAGFGWGRPVPVNPYALRPGRSGMAIVAAAGPVANVVVALVFAIVFRALRLGDSTFGLVDQIVGNVVLFNVVLGLFNLLPIPPLDGYNVVLAFVPPRQAFAMQRYAQYGTLLLLGLILVSMLEPSGGPIGWLFALAGLLTRLFIGA
ncbi:MAG: site-2 protease family protein [Candidatus Limnocylindria bacterium]|nr:MAG: site-2 protease family protein [Chloroflexota bacterium]